MMGSFTGRMVRCSGFCIHGDRMVAGTLNLSLAAVAFAGLGALLATNVLRLTTSTWGYPGHFYLARGALCMSGGG
jgi:hypothetical protein